MERTFTTGIIWHDSRGGECEAEVRVTYVARKGFAGDRIDPPEDASVEIIRISTTDGEPVPDRFLEDDCLIAECFEHWQDDEIAGEEYRAEMRAENLRMEKF